MENPRRSHLIPRTREGRLATVVFFALLALSMPPVTHTVLNRVDPALGGMPFFYTSLLVIYTALICVLLWALKRGV